MKIWLIEKQYVVTFMYFNQLNVFIQHKIFFKKPNIQQKSKIIAIFNVLKPFL